METTTRHRPIKQLCQLVRLKSTQIFILAGSVLLTLLITVICIGLTMRYEVENEVANVAEVNYWKDQVSAEQKLWYDKGIEELNMALREPSTENTVKNVRIFVIEGIANEELAAHRFPLNSNSSEVNTNFAWDQFLHVGRLKSNCIIPCSKNWIHQALWTGVPLDVLQIMDTNCSRQEGEGHLLSLLRQAQLADLRTGFVTNQRLTGPTGAALYGNHVTNLSNECEELSSEETLCNDDIAKQLIFGETGKYLNVIIGGGRQMFNHEVPVTDSDPIDNNLCRASNERNLLKNWRLQKIRQVKDQTRQRFELIQHFGELEAINGSKYDYLMAILSNGPKSSLFLGVKDVNYLAQAVAYALKN
ncbi:alkaline phosphatase 4 [Drosophila tropicalis]|uniref:alkaline phosphatase 4 n=1 Tax=Drosophila tropicalis TaxID=46794 RepID=UPI0035AB684F